MREYLKTQLPDVLTVRSIVTVYHTIMQNRISPGENHSFPELLYVAKGHIHVLVDEVLYELDEGQVILYAPFAFHRSYKPNTATVDIVSFESDSEMLAGLYNRVITLTSYQRTLLSRIITSGVEIFERGHRVGGLTGMAPREGTRDYELQQLGNTLELLLLDLLHTQTPPPGRPEAANRDNYRKEQFAAVNAYLQAHLSQPLTAEQISSACGMSVSGLKRLCHEQCGQPPMAYLTELRLRQAKLMILESTLNFTQIADALGFGSVHYFSRVFKEKVGMTPSEYAKAQSVKCNDRQQMQ